MACSRSLISLLVLCVVSVSLAENVPVFLWGDIGRSSIKHSALSGVTPAEFRKILKHALVEDPLTVVFIEKTLCVEDFSQKKDEDTSFPYLESEIGDAVYLPQVESPLMVLNKLADPVKVDHVKLKNTGLSADVGSPDDKFLFIHLSDAKEVETREEMLRRHNDFMEDMVNKLQEKYDKVAAIYTAHHPSLVEHSRVRRQAETQNKATDTPAVTSLNFSGLKIYFQTALFNNGTGNNTVLTGVSGDASSLVNDTTMSSTLAFSGDIKATLNFETMAGYWFLRSASLSAGSEEQILYPTDEENQLFGYSGFSYRCATNITFAAKVVNGTKEGGPWTLTLHNSRMQPFFVNDSSNLEFGDMLNCVGFFTAPIWAGLFVVAVLLAITFYGIMMMMDIRTMDRFDDPKGKTITINAE